MPCVRSAEIRDVALRMKKVSPAKRRSLRVSLAAMAAVAEMLILIGHNRGRCNGNLMSPLVTLFDVSRMGASINDVR